MQTYLRVKQIETGHELTVSQSMYDFAPDGYEVLDKPATDSGNNPLPPKHKTSVSSEAAKKTGGQSADPKKES